MRIINLPANSPLIEDVANLWRSNRQTLGFFPRSALEDYARRGGLLAAVDSAQTLAGYLLFYQTTRSSVPEIHIAHLCVCGGFRGRGLARELVGNLREVSTHCRGVRVRCRRDFKAHSLWPRLDFHLVGESIGRAGKPVSEWWLDFGVPDLFSQAASIELSTMTVVVIDACVFFAICDANETDSTESQALLADWLPESIALCVTPELRNEIGRSDCPNRRQDGLAAMSQFEELRHRIAQFRPVMSSLRRFLPADPSASDESDLRQLDHAICANATTFLTFDPRLLGLDEEVYQEFGLTIQRPVDFISNMDSLEREQEYRPGRFFGSEISARRVKGEEIQDLSGSFQMHALGERRGTFIDRISALVSIPDSTRVSVVLDSSEPLLLLSEDSRDNSTLFVDVLRLVQTRFGTIVADAVLSDLVLNAAREGFEKATIREQYISDPIESALHRNGFVKVGDNWKRGILRGLQSPSELVQRLRSMSEEHSDIGAHLLRTATMFEESIENEAWVTTLLLEDSIWPAKVSGTQIPSFVIPIRPDWASELFDHKLAASRLLESDSQVMLRSENVYYSAANCRSFQTPARILWYVSQDDKVPGSKAIRAASTLNTIVTDSAKNVFRQFRRMGIYNWRDVEGLTGKDGSVTALSFSRTEVFDIPVGWSTLQSTLEALEKRRNQFMRPTRIATRTYEEIYRIGMAHHPEKKRT